MKITPLEIRKKSFEKRLMGYDKEEVDAFLKSLSNEWERMVSDKKDLQKRLDKTEEDVQKLREVETSLHKTLKTAQDTSTNLIEQASKRADLTLREAEMKAEAIMNEAKMKSDQMVYESRNESQRFLKGSEQEVKKTLGNMRDELKKLENDYQMAEDYRDRLLLELKHLSEDTLNRVNKIHDNKVTYKEIIEKYEYAQNREEEMVKEIEIKGKELGLDYAVSQNEEIEKSVEEKKPIVLDEIVEEKEDMKEADVLEPKIPKEENKNDSILDKSITDDTVDKKTDNDGTGSFFDQL